MVRRVLAGSRSAEDAGLLNRSKSIFAGAGCAPGAHHAGPYSYRRLRLASARRGWSGPAGLMQDIITGAAAPPAGLERVPQPEEQGQIARVQDPVSGSGIHQRKTGLRAGASATSSIGGNCVAQWRKMGESSAPAMADSAAHCVGECAARWIGLGVRSVIAAVCPDKSAVTAIVGRPAGARSRRTSLGLSITSCARVNPPDAALIQLRESQIPCRWPSAALRYAAGHHCSVFRRSYRRIVDLPGQGRRIALIRGKRRCMVCGR